MIKAAFYSLLLLIIFLATTPKEIETIKHTWDKLNHILAFVTLYIVLSFSYKDLSLLSKFISLLAFGIFIEIVQYFIPNRDFSFYDIFADFIGILLGYFFLSLLKKI